MSPPVELDGRFVNWMNRLSVGEVSLPNCEGSRHHYVPQMLLRRFRGGGKLYECRHVHPREHICLCSLEGEMHFCTLKRDPRRDGVVDGEEIVASR